MPPVIIASVVMLGAEAAAAAGLIMATTAMYIGAAAMAAGTLLTKTPNFGNYASQSERKQVMRSSSAPVTRIYGMTELSGLMFFVEEQAGDGIKNEQLYMCLALAGHEIDGIDNIYLSDDEISTFGNLVEYELHNADGAGSSYLVTNAPSWSADMKGEGVAWLRMTFTFDAKKFPSGLPNIKVRLRGAKLWDPRNNTTAYSDNAALAILDFYRNVMKIPDSKLDLESFKVAANVCDELVQIGDGKTEKRYTVSGAFDLSEAPAKVLEGLHDACAGSPTYTAGKHGILAGAYMGPATFEIHEDQIIGDVRITPETAQSERTNKITGKFVDPTIHYGESDFPPIIIPEYIAEDGREIVEDIKYRFVTSHFQAQRLAQIHLNRKRIGRTLTLPMNMTGFSYRPGTYVKLFIKQLGINGAEFRVMKFGFGLKKGVELTLREESAATWADSIGKPITRPPLTTLSVGGPPTPANLRYEQQIQNDIVQGVLTWTNYYTQVIGFNVLIERVNDGKAIFSANVPREICHIKGLQAGNYRASVIAQGIMGQSAPAVVLFDVAVPAVPDSVEKIIGNWSVELRPAYVTPAPYGTLFEFYMSQAAIAPGHIETQAQFLGVGGYLTISGLTSKTQYFFYIRAVNSYGKSGFFNTDATTSGDASSVLDLVKGNISADHLVSDLREPIKEIATIGATVSEIKGSIDVITTKAIPDLQKGFTHLESIVTGGDGGFVQELTTGLKQAIDMSEEAAKAALEAATSNTEDVKRKDSILAQIKIQQLITVNQQEAQAKEIRDFNTRFGGVEAAIHQETETRSTALEGVARQLTQLGANIGSNAAAITAERDARVTAISEEAKAREQLGVANAQNAAQILEERRVRTSETAALGDRMVKMEAASGANAAAILEETRVRTNETGSLSTKLSQVESTANNAKAAIATESETRAQQDQANSQYTQRVEAKTDQATAAVQQVSSAHADLANNVHASWYTKASAGGHQAGFGLRVDMQADGSAVSSFVIAADLFKVVSAKNLDSDPAKATSLFAVQGQSVYINHALIDSAEIGNLIANYLRVTTLDAVNIHGSTISGSTISGTTINGSTVTGTTFTGGSVNIGNGAFTVDAAGNLHANSGSFGGTIKAAQIDGDVYLKALRDLTKQFDGPIHEGWTGDIQLPAGPAVDFTRQVSMTLVLGNGASVSTVYNQSQGRLHFDLLNNGKSLSAGYTTFTNADAKASAWHHVPYLAGVIDPGVSVNLVLRLTWSRVPGGGDPFIASAIRLDGAAALDLFKSSLSFN